MPSYKIYDENGRVLSEIASVLTPVPLTGVTTAATNILTVTSTGGLFPGMSIRAANVPLGSFIHSIISATEVELWRSKWDLTTGSWTTTAANANGTVAGPAVGPAYALGFDPLCLVAHTYAQGSWRNTIRTTATLASGLSPSYAGAGSPVLTPVPVPASISYPGLLTSVAQNNATLSVGTLTPSATIISDEGVATPLKRHNGEIWGVYTFVSTGGLQTLVRANPSHNIILSSAA